MVFRLPKGARRILWLAALGLAVLAGQGKAAAAQLELSWDDNSESEAAFSIERRTGSSGAFAEIGTQAPGLTSYSDSDLVSGTSYCYRVRAYNAVGYSPYSDEACAIAGGALNLTVSRTGSGTGTVTSTPAGIDCGTDCFESYPAVVPIILTAQPAPYSIFNGWSGAGCGGTAPCTLMGNRPLAIQARFTATYLLTVSTQMGSGTVSSRPAGISCGTDCYQRFPSGTVVTLTATPPPGAVFLGWSGSCRGTDPCTLTLSANSSVWAFFDR